MGLIIERPHMDIGTSNKIKIVLDNKNKYQLRPGEKIEVDVNEGLHRIDCLFSFFKGSKEIQYPQDNHIIVFYRVTPSPGVGIQNISEETSLAVPDNSVFCGQSALNGNPCELAVTDMGLIYRELGQEPAAINYYDINIVKNRLGNLALYLYSGESRTFKLPKEKFDQVFDFVKNKVEKCSQELHQGFNLSFGTNVLILVNETDETFFIQDGKNMSQIYKLDQILSYTVNETEASQDYMFDAALGSLIDGTRGAIFGALHSAQNGNKVDSVCMNLTIKTDNDVLAFCLNFGNSMFAMERNSSKYGIAMTQCTRFIAFMDDYKKGKAESYSKEESPAPNIPNNVNVTEELRKYKALLDDGIIDEEEFKAKKKQLLNI